MKRLQKILLSGKTAALTAMLAIILCCCKKGDNPSGIANLDDFIAKQEAGLFGYGGFLFKYVPQECQISINVKRCQIRLQNDNQTNWLHIQLARFPYTEGERLEVELRYMSGGDEIINSTEMETVKVGNGMFWLWDKKKNMGIILPQCW